MFMGGLGSTNKTQVSFKKFFFFFRFCKTYLPSIFVSQGLVNLYIYIYFYESFFGRLRNLTQLFLSLFFFSKTYGVVSTIVLHNDTLYRMQALCGFFLWVPNNTTEWEQPIFNPFIKPGEVKYKFLGKGSDKFLHDQFFKILNKYKELGLVFFKKFYYYANRKHFYKNRVVTNSFLTAPRFSSSSINKYIDLNNIAQYQFQYLRKNKVYNKGRYSRNRQNYRTGVYMCLYLSVISIFGLYYSFYKFAFKFTYLWWFFIAFLGSFIVPKAIKYRLYEPMTLLKRFFSLCEWFFSLLKPVLKPLFDRFIKWF